MKAAIAALALLAAAAGPATAGPVVQMPVPEPELPTGALAFVGASAVGDVYADLPSFKRSDLEGVTRGTVVLVRPKEAAPLQVVRTWIDCPKNVFQVDSGRFYDASGVQTGTSLFMKDQPIPAGTPLAALARVLCAPDLTAASTAFPGVTDWRAALARAKQ